MSHHLFCLHQLVQHCSKFSKSYFLSQLIRTLALAAANWLQQLKNAWIGWLCHCCWVHSGHHWSWKGWGRWKYWHSLWCQVVSSMQLWQQSVKSKGKFWKCNNSVKDGSGRSVSMKELSVDARLWFCHSCLQSLSNSLYQAPSNFRKRQKIIPPALNLRRHWEEVCGPWLV